MQNSKVLKFLYALLFVLPFISLAVFVSQLTTYGERVWDIYSKIYLTSLLFYTWFIFILLFLDDHKKTVYPTYNNEKIAVIVPCFNESLSLFKRSIESVIAASGNKHIIIVDDGSTNENKIYIKELAHLPDITVHIFDRNKGKRHALHHAIKNLIQDSEFIVTIDSDTVLDKEALIRVVEPLKNPRIGASTGDVQLLNEKENWLTRMIGSYYWIGLNIYKRAQSSIGMVVCCSGCLAAYKTSIITGIIDEFVNQEFLGERCTHSEDRHLTNLVLRSNYFVVYNPKAISYTETPSTVRGFLKQQQRWKRGYIRESLFTLTYAWRNKPLLFLQILLWDLTIPFFAFGLMLALIATIFADPSFFILVILPSWVTFMFIRYMPVLFYARDKILGLFIYMFFYEVFLYWQFIYALFTVKNKSWITR